MKDFEWMKALLVVTLTLLMVMGRGGQQLKAASIIQDVWQKSIIECEAQIKKTPTDIRLRFRLGVAYANMGNLEGAMSEFKELQQLEGGKLTRQVIGEYEAEYKKSPKDLITLNYLAFAYYANMQYVDSKRVFEEILVLDPESVWTLNYLAIVLGNLNEDNNAIKVLTRANKISDNKYTHCILAWIYMKKGNLVKGMWHLSKSGTVGLILLKN